jgi:hypothetical protein
MQWPRCVGVSTMSRSVVGLLGVLGLALTACGSDDSEGSALPRTPSFGSPPDLTIHADDSVVALGAHSYNTAVMVADGTSVPPEGPDLVIDSNDVVIEHPAGWTFTVGATSPGTNSYRTLSLVTVGDHSFRLVAPNVGGTYDVFLEGQNTAEHLGAGYVFRWRLSDVGGSTTPPPSTITPTLSSTPTTPSASTVDLQDPILRLHPGTERSGGDRNYDLLIGQPYQAEISACGGVRVLYPSINDATWITDEAGGELDWIPSEWSDIRSPESIITAELLLSDDNNLMVTVADRSVMYRPITPDEPASLCAF